MIPSVCLLLLLYCIPSLCQSISSSGSAPTTLTVTSIGTSAIVILPSSSSSSVSSLAGPSPTTPSTTTPSGFSSTTLALQTNPYTGQAILVGTCAIPQYTGLSLQDGAVIEVPLVGCSDDRPECCPSLSPPEVAPSSGSSPTITSSPSTRTPTGVISMLSASPLSICPQGFVDIDPVCCPSGYSLYGQPVLGNTPCYSILSTTVPLPTAVLISITSAVAATAVSATATVSVIINQVFALGLPCAGGNSSGLSTGAKAGIGIGAAVGGLLLILLSIGLCILARRKRENRQPPAPTPVYYNVPLSPPSHEKYGSQSIGGMPSPGFSPHAPFGFQPQPQPWGYPAAPSFDPNQQYSGWQAPRHTSNPPQYQSQPVEMQTPQNLHEIGDGRRQRSTPASPAGKRSDVGTSEISAYEVQRRGVD